ncbi:MAG: hypothetical protein ACI9TV_000775, partial [Sulfurimonas sp.]
TKISFNSSPHTLRNNIFRLTIYAYFRAFLQPFVNKPLFTPNIL